jgi:hypothetical protein
MEVFQVFRLLISNYMSFYRCNYIQNLLKLSNSYKPSVVMAGLFSHNTRDKKD